VKRGTLRGLAFTGRFTIEEDAKRWACRDACIVVEVIARCMFFEKFENRKPEKIWMKIELFLWTECNAQFC
jgi:hypothetical protein